MLPSPYPFPKSIGVHKLLAVTPEPNGDVDPGAMELVPAVSPAFPQAGGVVHRGLIVQVAPRKLEVPRARKVRELGGSASKRSRPWIW